ncbi:MAG TPA: winged helix DNA-binding protein [Pyrinomonadaceae bacterium]
MEIKTPELRDKELAKEILNFLAERSRPVPLEEVAEWWIVRPLRVDLNVVARAVQRLTEKGLLEAVGEGRSRLYQLKRPAGSRD